MELAHEDVEKILNVGIRLSTEKEPNRLLAFILENAMEITNCDAGTLYLYEEEQLVFKIMKNMSMGISSGVDGEVLGMPPVAMEEENVCAYAAMHREVVHIPDLYANSHFDFSGPRQYDALTGYHTRSVLVVPLENNENELLGVLQLINAMDEEENVIPFLNEHQIVIRSLASMAAIALTNISYMEELKRQFYSFADAFATAIDERTPYNGSHTRNVARYAGMLAEYIRKMHMQGRCKEDFDEERKESLVLAALLHDIGKMVIPLSIMNRATRLDKGLERVEQRFELLEGFFAIDMLRGRISEAECEEKISELKEGLELIHRVDKAEYLNDEDYERIQKLSEQKYTRTNKTEILYLTEKERDSLSVRRGTLTETQRGQMESHAVMTERILSKVQFYKSYSMVPKWAASHHELLDGTGYPKHLKAGEIDLETRIITIADIYDALTAKDRPYKPPMPGDRALEILRSMAGEGKLELRLVEWFGEALAEEEDKK